MYKINKHMITHNLILDMYLDYVNNFLTVEKFAEHYNITENLAKAIINAGKILNNN